MNVQPGEEDGRGSSEILKGHISEEMISEKFMKFMSEGRGKKHIYKISLLEARYNSWLKRFEKFSNKRKTFLLNKKKNDKKMIPTAIDSIHSHIRWIKFSSGGLMACIKSSAVVLASGYYFFIYDLNENSWKIISSWKFQAVDGIGCLEGARNENLFAFSEKCKGSGIYLVTYPDLEVAYMLRDRLGGKVKSINFGENETLVVLKCLMSEHHIVIWSWRTSKVIFSYPYESSYLHPEIFRVNHLNSSCAQLIYEENEQIVYFWNINFCGEDTVFINRHLCKIKINNEIHDMFFDADDTLYLLDCKGTLYSYDYADGKVTFVLPWNTLPGREIKEPLEPTAPEYREQKHLPSNLLKLSKGKPIVSPKNSMVDKEEPERAVGEDEISVHRRPYIVYDSDEYDDKDGPESVLPERAPGRRCHMISFNSGIVVSGPDGRVKYYTRSSAHCQWKKAWGFIPADPFTQFVTNQRRDVLLAWSNKYGLVGINTDSIQSKVLYYFGGKIRDMCFIHPADSNFITINDEPVLYIWKKKTGRLLTLVELPCELDAVVAAGEWPLVVGKAAEEGALYGLDLTEPRAPRVWTPLHLTRDPLRSISFLHDKDLLAALSADRKTLFLIKVNMETGLEVVSSWETCERVLGVAGVGRCEVLSLLEAVPPEEGLPPGAAGKVLTVLRYPRAVVERTWVAAHLYRAVHTGPGQGQVLAIPADLKDEVHSFHLDFNKAGGWQFLGAIKVCHQVGNFNLHIHKQHLVTYGFDGLVTCYDPVTMFDHYAKPFCVLVPHHRYDGKIQQVIIDYKANYVISRGKDGLSLCSRIKLENRCNHSSHTPRKGKSLNRIGLELKHVIKYGENYWEDVYKAKRLELDKIISAGLINRMRQEIEEIKKIWHHCFAENQKERPENRIPLDDFELNKVQRDHLIVVNENDISERLSTFERLILIHRAWNRRWEELCCELMPQKLLKLKPFIASYFIENFNQSLKPEKYLIHNGLLRIVSDLDAALFPIPDPKMFPWLQLDDDEEYREFKLQKFPIELISPRVSETKTPQISEEVKEDTSTVGEIQIDEEVKKESQKSHLDLTAVIRHQEQVLGEMNADRRIEKEKLIFSELENIRQFYNEKYLIMKYRKEGMDKTFEEFKKEIINPKSSDSEEEQEVKVLEANIFEDDLAVIAGKPEKGEEEEIEAEEGREGEVEGEGEASVEGRLEEGEGAVETEELAQGEADQEEKHTDTSSIFSWGEIEVGVQKPPEVVELSQKKSLIQRTREQRGEASLLEFADLKKKSVVREVGVVDPLEEPLCMNGSWSLRFVDASYGRCNEFSLNGLFMSDSLMQSLQMIIDELENDFNKRFTSARERKSKDISRIKNRNATLRKHIDDLVNVCKGIPPCETIVDYEWSYDELMPNGIWMSEIKNEKKITTKIEKSKTLLDEAGEEGGEQERTANQGIEQPTEDERKIDFATIGLEPSEVKAVNKENWKLESSSETSPLPETTVLYFQIIPNGDETAGSAPGAIPTVNTNIETEEMPTASESANDKDVTLDKTSNKTSSRMSNKSTKRSKKISNSKSSRLSGLKESDKLLELRKPDQSILRESTIQEKSIKQSKKKRKSSRKSKTIDEPSEVIEDVRPEVVEEELEVNEESVETNSRDQEVVTAAGTCQESVTHTNLGNTAVETAQETTDQTTLGAEEDEKVEGTNVSGTDHEDDTEPEAQHSTSQVEDEAMVAMESAEDSVEVVAGSEGSSEGEEVVNEEEKGRPAPPTQEQLDRAMLQEYLDQMMGGAFQLTWQERLMEEIPVPNFLFEKEPDEFSTEDAEMLEKYLKEKARREKLIQFHKKQAEDEIKKILFDVKEIIYKHDMDLLDTLQRKINVEGCIQSELLKVARMKQKKLIAHNTLKNLSHMKDLLCDFYEQGMKLSKMSKHYLKKTAMLHNEFEKHQTALKNIDADFLNKLEPMKLTKKYTEILKNCMKKKPLNESELHPIELLTIARALKQRKNLPYLSEASKSFFKSLKEIDAQNHCPPSLDPDVWNTLIDCRHNKIVSDLKCKALMILIAEAEKTSSLYYKYFVSHLQRYDKIKCHIRDQKIRLEHHCKKMEILLPEGLIESHHTGNIDDFKDCVYISRKFIDNLNQEIVELQMQKEQKWKDFDNYMEVVNSAELLHKELRLKLRVYDNLLRDIKTAQINKYTKDFLAEYYRRKKPNYDVKLQDLKKQEKIKTMVRRYFDSYYRAIKDIRTVKNTRDQWIKENIELSERNDRLAAENQEMLLDLEKLNKLNKDDQLQEERNRAILMHSKLSRKYDANAKKIDELEAELHRLYMKNYPTFEGFTH